MLCTAGRLNDATEIVYPQRLPYQMGGGDITPQMPSARKLFHAQQPCRKRPQLLAVLPAEKAVSLSGHTACWHIRQQT